MTPSLPGRPLAASILLTICSLAVAAPGSPPGAAAFDQAFRFASAITVDPNDMMLAQESVVLDLGAAGGLDRALELAAKVEGWRRGVVYAELATMLAGAGRPDDARAAVAKAETVRAETSGWQNPRIAQHIANAWAALGEVDRAASISGAAAPEDRQYLGRPAATHAVALGRAGRFDEAMRRLAELDAQTDPDVTWWRTWGYTELVRLPALAAPQRAAARTAAQRSAGAIAGWRQGEALEQLADAALDRGDKASARALLAEAEAIVRAQSDQALPVKAPLLAAIARDWAAAGEPARAKAALDEARKAAAAAQPIDQPAAQADLANAAAVLGDRAAAGRGFSEALARAATLENARPRALAVVEVCRAIGRAGLPLDEATRAQLDRIYAGLKDPW